MKATALTFETLFDAGFLAEVSRWSLASRRTSARGLFGLRRSPSEGAGLEFKNFRPYASGDDLRSIDWNLYRRLGKPFTRRFEEEKNLPVYLLLDTSQSMRMQGLEETTPLMAGMRTAVALAAMALNHHDTVGVFPFHAKLCTLFKGRSGRHQLLPLARTLTHFVNENEAGSTDLPGALRHFSSLGLRRGLVFIISDFFDPSGIEALEDSLRGLQHQPLLVQLRRREDSQPTLAPEACLVDSETGARLEVTGGDETLRRYQQAYSEFNYNLDAVARARGGRVARIEVGRPLLGQLACLTDEGGWVA